MGIDAPGLAGELLIKLSEKKEPLTHSEAQQYELLLERRPEYGDINFVNALLNNPALGNRPDLQEQLVIAIHEDKSLQNYVLRVLPNPTPICIQLIHYLKTQQKNPRKGHLRNSIHLLFKKHINQLEVYELLPEYVNSLGLEKTFKLAWYAYPCTPQEKHLPTMKELIRIGYEKEQVAAIPWDISSTHQEIMPSKDYMLEVLKLCASLDGGDPTAQPLDGARLQQTAYWPTTDGYSRKTFGFSFVTECNTYHLTPKIRETLLNARTLQEITPFLQNLPQVLGCRRVLELVANPNMVSIIQEDLETGGRWVEKLSRLIGSDQMVQAAVDYRLPRGQLKELVTKHLSQPLTIELPTEVTGELTLAELGQENLWRVQNKSLAGYLHEHVNQPEHLENFLQLLDTPEMEETQIKNILDLVLSTN